MKNERKKQDSQQTNDQARKTQKQNINISFVQINRADPLKTKTQKNMFVILRRQKMTKHFMLSFNRGEKIIIIC
jgi:hypothetical protein